MGKVITLNCITKLDLPVDRVLDGAKEKLKSAVILGYDKDGEYYFAGTYAGTHEVLWLLEKAKQAVLNQE